MSIFKTAIILFAVVYIIVIIPIIFRYLITIKKLKPNKLSRSLYEDDESFIKSWKKIKEKGMLKHVLQNTIIWTIIITIIMYIISISLLFLLDERSVHKGMQYQTLFYPLLEEGIILSILKSLMQWFFGKNRYNHLKEKGKIESGK